ncbi:MAG: type II secretion system F family protein [Gammaproteobacteria bacterium]|nr:type II secretion system F family protein [Gammaproteobacteria bacterium]NNM12832.1 type II secretion system F family protein [Gammaproteobacteria bacterium]
MANAVSNTYVWKGKNKQGRSVTKTMNAASPEAVKSELRRQGIIPTSVRKKSVSKRGKVTPADIAVFSRQLATMMESGVPLVQSFEIIGRGHENPAMQKLLMAIKGDIEGGASLAEAMSKHPLHFDELFTNLVTAGEQAGALETLLDKIAVYKEKSESTKKKIKKAMTYPIAVLVVAVVVTIILLVKVIPQFESLFTGFGADLPAFTQFVVDLSYTVRNKGIFIFGIPAAIIGGMIYMNKRSKKFRHQKDKVLLKLPIIGNIVEKASIARFARTLATMFSAGVPLVEALESVAGATGNIVYEEATLNIKDDVSTGQRMQVSMETTDLFPNMVVQMIGIGEEAGSLDVMSAKVADYYEEEVDNAVDNMSTLMEPIIMGFLAIVVGGLVIAMYLPIFKMGSVI